MYGHRGAWYGSGGFSDGYEVGSKRPRMMESNNPYFAVSSGSSFGYGVVRHEPPPFPVVRLRGLPFDCDQADVVKFFSGLDIVDVFFVNKDGRFSGEAFVVFAGNMHSEHACQRNHQNMGRRYVEVFRSNKQDYYRAIASEVSEGGGSDCRGQYSPPARRKRSPDKDHLEYTETLKMRGLPYSVTKLDIIQFFADFKLTEDKIKIAYRHDGKASGEAFVEFASVEEAREAMSKDKKMIGSRYVELFPSKPNEARRASSGSRR